MNIETIRDYCISKEGVAESFPFGDDTLVFKAGEKNICIGKPRWRPEHKP